jgi:hypothetical protein
MKIALDRRARDPANRCRARKQRKLWFGKGRHTDRLPQPVLNVFLAKEQTAIVSDPALGWFSWELTMPLCDLWITSRAQYWRFPESGQPIIAKTRVINASTVATSEEGHDRFIPRA